MQSGLVKFLSCDWIESYSMDSDKTSQSVNKASQPRWWAAKLYLLKDQSDHEQ